jgi:hypothetical protein
MFRKNVIQIEIAQIEHKIPTQNGVFPGVRRLTTSFYIADDCTTSGNTDL